MTLEIPPIEELDDLGIVVEPLESDTVAVCLTAWSADGDMVVVTWSGEHNSVSVRWEREGSELLFIERECVRKVSARKSGQVVTFLAWSIHGEVGGELSVAVGDTVYIRDVLLEGRTVP